MSQIGRAVPKLWSKRWYFEGSVKPSRLYLSNYRRYYGCQNGVIVGNDVSNRGKKVFGNWLGGSLVRVESMGIGRATRSYNDTR